MSSFFVAEEQSEYVPHDLLFKTLIEAFFEEFMEVFFPELYNKIDFKTVKFLSKGVIPDTFKAAGRRVDIVVESKWKETNLMIIIHVEPQSYNQENFSERMFAYYCMLYGKYRQPIIPIAVLAHDQVDNKGYVK